MMTFTLSNSTKSSHPPNSNNRFEYLSNSSPNVFRVSVVSSQIVTTSNVALILTFLSSPLDVTGEEDESTTM